MGLGRGGNQDTGIGMFTIRSKPAACGASPLFHLSSCGEFFRLEDLTSQGRRMGAGVCGGSYLPTGYTPGGQTHSFPVPLLLFSPCPPEAHFLPWRCQKLQEPPVPGT